MFPKVKDAWLPVTGTGVFKPPTVLPCDDVIDIPESVILASPVTLSLPMLELIVCSDAITVKA